MTVFCDKQVFMVVRREVSRKLVDILWVPIGTCGGYLFTLTLCIHFCKLFYFLSMLMHTRNRATNEAYVMRGAISPQVLSGHICTRASSLTCKLHVQHFTALYFTPQMSFYYLLPVLLFSSYMKPREARK